MKLLKAFLILGLTVLWTSSAFATEADWLEEVRAEHDAPALGVMIIENEQVRLLAVTGERKLGSGIPVETGDLWHIGSNAKAMTATLIARLVERGDLNFDTTIGEVFSDFAEEIHPIFRQVTLTQLLSHQAGLKPNPGALAFFGYFLSEESIMGQRIDVVKTMTGEKPEYEPGTEFRYSNAGYVIAGAMAERATGKSWERLIEEEVFTPLGITSFGFGAPGQKEKVDQPRGHKKRIFGFGRTSMKPSPQADNPPILGPAGTVHMTLEDWAIFAVDQIKGEKGEGALLAQETYALLHQGHRVISEDASYAFGWGVSEIEGTGLRMLGHSGSNTMWYARIELIPERDLVILLVTNDGTKKGKAVLRAARERVYEIYLASSGAGAQ